MEGHGRRSRDAPTVGGARSWPHGLPVPFTAFVGRDHDRTEVGRLLSASRLVTLTGAGGIGKTRLAIEVAAVLAADFGDGAVLIDLSAVSDPALLPNAVARSLAVEERSTGVQDRLIQVLRTQHRLLVLDNCEHLRAGCAGLTAAVLGACPEVVVLATSRERLGVPGEVTWRVPSLSFPWAEQSLTAESLEGFEAAALFVERARAASPGLPLGPGDLAAIAKICFRLDGIPLALELAAARAGALSLTEIADRLTDRFGLLTGTGTGPARHQTLRSSIEWSYQLLSDRERALFGRLAVFAGGWELAAAEAVCGTPPLADEQVAALLAALADKSLVQVEVAGTAGRYRLLEVIKAFARQRMADAGELAQMRARHGAYYAERAERAAPLLLGPDQADCARRLDQETGNLRAAHAWCGEDPARAATGLRLAAGLWEYWHIRGHLAEGTAWLREALAAGGEPVHARAAALNGLGVLVSIQGDPSPGPGLFAQSIDCFRRAGDRHGEARAWTHLGNGRVLCGDAAAAAQAFDRGLALSRELGDTWLEAFALFLSAWAALLTDDSIDVRAQLITARRLFDEVADHRAAGYSALALGDYLLREGDPAQALAVGREGIAVFEALPERWGLMYGAKFLAQACAAVRDWPRAVMLLGIHDMLGERTGGQAWPHEQAALDEIASRAETELGPAMPDIREAGRALGRHDQFTAALWPAADPAGQSSAGGLPLTRREHQIAGLLSEGLTNRQIAARLVIAERTVDTHVGRILAKLGCTRRAQAAAIVTAAGTRQATPPAKA